MTKLATLLAVAMTLTGGMAYYQWKENTSHKRNPENTPDSDVLQQEIPENTKDARLRELGELGLSEQEEELVETLIETEYKTKVVRSKDETKKKQYKKKEIVIF
ncbi:MAG: hypothetical protein KDD36_09170 [Flavobacteriales bacterium]|nr:hypothetical protein [Flavobacteriales bacterium]